MQEYNVLLQYILSIIAGFICVVLTLIKYKEKQANKDIYKSFIVYVVNITLIAVTYFYIFFREICFDEYDVNIVLRGMDYFLHVFLLYTWIALIKNLSVEYENKVKRFWFITGKVFAVLSVVVFMVIAVVYMDQYYYLKNQWMQDIYRVFEIIFALVGSTFVLIYAMKSIPCIVISCTRMYIGFGSAALVVYFLSQPWLTYDIGSVELLTWGNDPGDFEGWILLALNVLACYFTCVNDFHESYKSTDKEKVIETDILVRTIDEIAEAHKLTNREREIVPLVYMGASNAQVAEQLFVSLNTVKTHMKNIFEKLDVASRMELVYLINRQINTDKSYQKNDEGKR